MKRGDSKSPDRDDIAGDRLAIAFATETGAPVPSVSARIAWIRRFNGGKGIRDTAKLREHLADRRKLLEENREPARAFFRRCLETPFEEIPFAEQKAGIIAMEWVRDSLRDIAAYQFLLEEAEYGQVIRLVPEATGAGRTPEALEVSRAVDGLPPYEQRRLLALAQQMADKVRERQKGNASAAKGPDDDEPDDDDDGPETLQ